METVLVSACLAGLATRHDGGECLRRDVLARLKEEDASVIPVCPEQLGGLSTPRPASEIEQGDGDDVLEGRAKVTTAQGRDATEEFTRGARSVLRIAELTGARRAVLKAGSPSCGAGTIRHGGRATTGFGVTAALLRRAGLEVVEIE